MTSYLSGAEILADARMRLSGLPHDQGVLILEGGDDVRLFLDRAVGLESLIASGCKRKLLEAHALLQAGEHLQMVFLTDCDYDVPTGRLTPSRNLIVTKFTDIEADLLALGVLERIVLELVPQAVASDQQRETITTAVMRRASALAGGVGRFRLLSAQQRLCLVFTGLKLSRHRTQGAESVDIERLARTLAARSGSCRLNAAELAAAVAEIESDAKLCHGKDLLYAIVTVLHQDYGVPRARLTEVQSMLRLALTPEAFERWEVVRRIEAWERRASRRVLASS
jgi:hypothetical protein